MTPRRDIASDKVRLAWQMTAAPTRDGSKHFINGVSARWYKRLERGTFPILKPFGTHEGTVGLS